MGEGFDTKERKLSLYVRAVRDAHANYNIALSEYLDAVLDGNETDDILDAWWKAEAEMKKSLIELHNFQQVCELAIRFKEDLSCYEKDDENAD